MSSTAEPERRYPKRQRTAVAYSGAAGHQDDLDDDSETVPVAANTNSTAVANDEASNSDSDDDWTQKPKRKRRCKKPKTKKPKSRKPKPFPFLKLPAELRDTVYKLVVGNADSIVSIEPTNLTNTRLRRTLDESYRAVFPGQVNWVDRKRFRNLRLLRVSKVIYREAAVVMYTKQKFVFTRLSALQTFLLLLRPETLDRLVNVEVAVGESEWTFMPAVSSQLLQLHYLQALKISGLSYNTSGRHFMKYLKATGRPHNTWKVTIESLDKMMGIKLARDMYPFMYPFFNTVIRAAPAASTMGDVPESALSDASQARITGDLNPTSAEGSRAHSDEEEESPYKPMRGVDALVQALELEEDGFPGWYPYGSFWSTTAFSKLQDAKNDQLTDERRSTRRAAMKEELLMLMAKDSF